MPFSFCLGFWDQLLGSLSILGVYSQEPQCPRGREELKAQSLPGSLLLVLLLAGAKSGPSVALCVHRLLPTSVSLSSCQRSLRGRKDWVTKMDGHGLAQLGSLVPKAPSPLTFPPG